MVAHFIDNSIWFDNDAWHFMTQELGKLSSSEFWRLVFPKSPPFDSPNIIYYESAQDGFFNLFVIETNREKTTYLYGFLSDFLQNFLTFFGRYTPHRNIDMLRKYQGFVYDTLVIFNACCQFRINFSWFIIFNPYQQPFDTLRTLTDWWLNMLSGGLPLILGIDYSGTIATMISGFVADFLRTLAFTLPYRVDEGQLLNAEDIQNLEDPELTRLLERYGDQIRLFHKLPAVWVEHPIPNNLREYWLNKRPYITEFLIKNYYEDLGVDFLPNRLLKQLQQTPKVGSIINNLFHNFENISTNFSYSKSNVVLLDLIHLHPHL